MTNDTLIYDAWNYNYTVDMERAKGKLIIEVEDLPDYVNYSDKTIGGLYKNLNSDFKYSEATSVYSQNEWEPSSDIVIRLYWLRLKWKKVR